MSRIFDLEENRVKNEIIKHGAQRVLIQLPEGLRHEALRISSVVEEAGALAVVSADPCYGACDLALNEALILGADLIIHYGHSEVERFKQLADVPVIYIEARANISIKDLVENALNYLNPWERIGLATVVQHAHTLQEAEEILKNAGKKVYVGHEAGLKYPGQVLGCDYRNAKAISRFVEAFLFIGGGLFHAVGLSLATMKPTILIEPFEGRIYSVEDEARRIINSRWADISEASGAKTWGVIIGLKSGQLNFDASIKAKKDIEGAGGKAILLAMREITPEILLNFPEIEAYVNTACPRISFYRPRKFHRPVLTIRELHVALGKISWEEYLQSGLL
ncbi:MAG: diphthamide biosynthesis enzyme Dph2 [Candidatus Bathyarchaeota archaeon]|nr:diphthamide biosynthesis enzyme Dph2 [Candidatus Bathyarchaeota archaeon]